MAVTEVNIGGRDCYLKHRLSEIQKLIMRKFMEEKLGFQDKEKFYGHLIFILHIFIDILLINTKDFISFCINYLG